MAETPYTSEDLFQKLLERYAELQAGDQFGPGEPRRWALVARETPVPNGAEGANRWALDHLFLDQDAIPTLVEVKRRSDTRSRREVVGQMFDYAANGPAYWSMGKIREAFDASQRSGGQDPEEALAALTGQDRDLKAYWSVVEDNLRRGRPRMVFVVDVIPHQLRRIVDFLSRQLRDVEVRQHVGKSGQVLATTVTGSNLAVAGKPSAVDGMSDDAWIAAFESRHGAENGAIARKIMSWMKKVGGSTFTTSYHNPSCGMVVMQGSKKTYPFFIVTNGKASIPLGYLKTYDPFREDDARAEIVSRGEVAIGHEIVVTSLAGNIGLSLGEIAYPMKREQFLGAVPWVAEPLKAA